MSSLAALAAISASQAAAHRAKVSECKVVEHEFDSYIASVAEKVNYADCIDVLYPKNISAEGLTMLKVLFVVFLISVIYGVYKAWKDGDRDIIYYVVYSLSYGLGIPCILVAIVLIVIGIGWVLF